MKLIKIKKMKNTNQNAIVKVNNLELQPEVAKSAKKQIPKILSFDEAMELLSEYGYQISWSKMCELIVIYSIPFKSIMGKLSINRNKFLEWFNFNPRPIRTLEQELLSSHLEDFLKIPIKK